MIAFAMYLFDKGAESVKICPDGEHAKRPDMKRTLEGNGGQTSKLRKGLCEAVGQLIGRVQGDERHIAVVPDTPFTKSLAAKMVTRATRAGIEIALVSRSGSVRFLSSNA